MERIGGDVTRQLRRLGPAGETTEIVRLWPTLVGEAIARNAWPARVSRDGTLHVAASSSAWAFELGQLAPEIHRRLKEALGEAAPKSLRFALGTVPEPPLETPPAGGVTAAGPGPAELALAAELAAPIEDEELRAAVARAAAASLYRGTANRRL